MDDKKAVLIARECFQINFLNAYERGYRISKKRIIQDMHVNLDLVNSKSRLGWIDNLGNICKTVDIRGNFMDIAITKENGIIYSSSDASIFFKLHVIKVLPPKGGERAVAEACLNLKAEINVIKLCHVK